MSIKQVFAHWVIFYRKKYNWSQEELAEKADLHRTYIGSIERCERNITLINADKIAQALSVKLTDLLNEKLDEVKYAKK